MTLPIEQLRLEQVSLKATVGGQYLLHDISFQVVAGERLAIVGASGAGKTSLLRLLNRLSEPSQGKIYFEQQDIRQFPVHHLRQQVTLVLQEPRLLGMTVRDALTYPLRLRQLAPALIEQRLQSSLEQLHIPADWLDRTEVQLSAGQRQLVSLGRALITQPKVLLLDEPTSALDAGRGAHLMQVLRQLSQQPTTVVMVNHQIDLVEQFCDRLLYLQQGRLVADRAASQVNWNELKQNLIQENAQDAEEWM